MAKGDARQAGEQRRKAELEDDLNQIELQMNRWAGASIERIQREQERYDADRAERDRVVGKAIRAGLNKHRFVQAWLTEKRTFGDKDALRRFRAGHERGLHRTMSKGDFYVAFYTADLLEKAKDEEDRMGWEQIRRTLCHQLRFGEPEPFFDLSNKEREELAIRLQNMSRQGFHRWLKKLGLIEPR